MNDLQTLQQKWNPLQWSQSSTKDPDPMAVSATLTKNLAKLIRELFSRQRLVHLLQSLDVNGILNDCGFLSRKTAISDGPR